MKTKFKQFLNTIKSNDISLIEAIENGYNTIYEGKIGNTLAATGLALGLMGGGSPAHANFFSHNDKENVETQSVSTPEQIRDTTVAYLQEISDYFIDNNDFMHSPTIKKLADYIKALPEKLKFVAQSEISRYRNTFKLGTPDNNIQAALAKYNIMIK